MKQKLKRELSGVPHKKVRKSRSGFVFSVMITVILLIALVFFVYEVANNQAQVRRSTEALNAMLEEEKRLEIDNGQFKRYIEGDNLGDYLDRQARNMGYADPQERIFYVNPAN